MPPKESYYEAGAGIRPARADGKLRATAREVVPGGWTEFWRCDHDHAPGVRDIRDVTADQREDALRCAETHLRRQIALYELPPMQVRRSEEPAPAEDHLDKIIARYRELTAAMDRFFRLQHEVAVMFDGLNEAQKQEYIGRLEAEDEEHRARVAGQ